MRMGVCSGHNTVTMRLRVRRSSLDCFIHVKAAAPSAHIVEVTLWQAENEVERVARCQNPVDLGSQE